MLNKNKKNIIIVGAGQLGILISNILIKQKSFNILGFIDNDKKKLNKFINNYKVIGSESYLFKNKKKYINLAIAVGDIIKREKIIKKLKNQNFAFPSIVDISCNIDKGVKLGKGSIISNSTTILNDTKIGEFSLVGTGVNILHNVEIGNNCIIGGGTTIGSNVQIKNKVFVGVGSTFASKKIKVEKNSFICSGSVIFNNVKAGSKMIGNPARAIPGKF